MSKSKRTSYEAPTDVPRVAQHTRFFKAKKGLCRTCGSRQVEGKLNCDGCVDRLREDKAATEMRFLARADQERFLRIVGQIFVNGLFP